MFNVNTASTMEVQLERDKSQDMIQIIEQAYLNGLITMEELFQQGAPWNRHYRKCLAGLNMDFDEAVKLAEKLS